MTIEKADNEQRDDDASHAADSSLSSTMRLPMMEFDTPEAEMVLDVRSADDAKPYSIRIEKATYEIGRSSSAGIPLIQPGVSRRHARLFHLHAEEIIEDLNSTNGTYVNGVRITRCVLQNNDVIRIGDATLLFTRRPGSQA
jgi:pSer/pThr/pTyr-binding forkhead associated (FHA) protein